MRLVVSDRPLGAAPAGGVVHRPLWFEAGRAGRGDRAPAVTAVALPDAAAVLKKFRTAIGGEAAIREAHGPHGHGPLRAARRRA